MPVIDTYPPMSVPLTGGETFIGTQGGFTKTCSAALLGVTSILTPEMFGAVGDGVADDTEAMQALLDRGGGALFAGIYRITSPLVGTLAVQWRFQDGSYIDASALTGSQAAVTVTGSRGAGILLTANAAVDARTITVASATGLQVGSYVFMDSNARFDPTRTNTKIGQVNQIVGISGLTLTLLNGLRFAFNTADAATLYPQTMLEECAIDGLKIVGEEGGKFLLGFVAGYWRGGEIRNTDIRKCSTSALGLSNSWGVRVYNPFDQIFQSTDLGYGVSVGGCEDIVVTGHTSFGPRHAITCGGNSPGWDVTYRDFEVYAAQRQNLLAGGCDAVDSHAAAGPFRVINGTIYDPSGSGINIESPSVLIEDVTIINAGGNGVQLSNHTSYDGRYVIKNLRVRTCVGVGLRTSEHVGGATGRILELSVRGFDCTGHVSLLMQHSNSGTRDTVVTLSDIHGDCASSLATSAGQVLVANAKHIVTRGGYLTNVPFNGVGWRFDDTGSFANGDLGVVEFATGTNSSGIGFRFLSNGAAYSIEGMLSGRVVATGTNTASCFSVDSEITGAKFLFAGGNAATPLQRTTTGAGTLIIAPSAVDSQTVSVGGAITLATTALYGVVVVAGNASAADDLDTANVQAGMPIGALRLFKADSDAITIRDGAGNFNCAGGGNIVLDSADDGALFEWTGTQWQSAAPLADNS